MIEQLQGIDGSAILILGVVAGCAYLVSLLGQWYTGSKKQSKTDWVEIDRKVYR